MAKVFISHASDDQAPTDEVHRWLVAEGHQVFLDQDPRDGIEVGDGWEQRLHERLRWADAMVCVITSSSVASTWCTAEISFALAQGSRLFPVRAEPKVEHPLLKSAQHADLIRDSVTARAALVEALRRVDAAGGYGWPDDRSPFPGLRPFDVEDHRVFFGRSRELDQLTRLLRSPAERAAGAVLLVVGPSGCGKSSLVRAGLLHAMAEEPGWWTLPPILPGADPVAALVRQLAAVAQRLGLNWTVADIQHRLDDDGLTRLTDELLLAARARRLLIVVDQFEELLTQTPPEQRAQFAQLLHPALGGPVQVVATLRPEFLNQLLVDSHLAVLPTHTYTLRPLSRDALQAVIQGPAQLTTMTVADDLVTRLVTDTDSGEALPLLAFTLSQLAAGIGRGGQLSGARYDQLGGVQGALARQADAALADATAATGQSAEEVIAGLLRLVTVDEQGHPTRWRVDRSQLPDPVTQGLDAFVTQRLLTTDTNNGSVVVGVTHEAFLSAWPPLALAIEKNKSALRARRAVEQAATEWNDHGRPTDRLWERGQLAAAVTDTGAHLQAHDLATDRVDLSQTARTFLRSSIRRDRVRRGRAITVLSVLLVLAVAAAGIAFAQQRAAEEQRNVALSRQVAGQALDLRTTNPALAAQLGLAAYQLAPTTEARGSLLSTVANPYAIRLTGHTDAVSSVVFSPDGRTLATASYDTTARLWDISDPHQPAPLGTPLIGHNKYVSSVAFSRDGRTLATASHDKTTRLWDISDPHQPTPLGTLTGHIKEVNSVAFSPDGHTLATASHDKTARLWNISDPHQPSLLGTLTGHDSNVYSVAFSPNGNTLATASHDDTVRLWDDLPGPIVASPGRVSAVAFSPDDRTLATGSHDKTARLWDISNPRQPSRLGTLTGHAGYVYSVAFSPDGRILATASKDKTARLWDISNPHRPKPMVILKDHSQIVYSVAFSPDGRTLATAGDDETTRLWDISNPYQPTWLATLASQDIAISSVAFSGDGRTIATASFDHTTQLWDVRDPRQPTRLAILTGHTREVNEVTFSPDGKTLATASFDHTIQLWDVRDPRQPNLITTLRGHISRVSSVAFSGDGRTLATASHDNTAQLWDISDLRQPILLATLTGHTEEVDGVAFSSDGRTLATASFDDTARLWETSVENATARICSITWPPITKNEWGQYLPDLPYQTPCPQGARSAGGR